MRLEGFKEKTQGEAGNQLSVLHDKGEQKKLVIKRSSFPKGQEETKGGVARNP